MDKKNCIIIHGCPSNKEKAMNPEDRTFDKHWIPWLREELTKKGIDAKSPLLPEPWDPVYERFKGKFDEMEVDENTTLVGHSCGCSFLVRWLGDTKIKIDKLVLVAPWKIPQSSSKAEKEFYEFPIDSTIKERVNKIIIFTSDNEEEDGKRGVKMFNEALGGEIINLKGRGHYTMGDMGTNEFPKLLEVVLD